MSVAEIAFWVYFVSPHDSRGILARLLLRKTTALTTRVPFTGCRSRQPAVPARAVIWREHRHNSTISPRQTINDLSTGLSSLLNISPIVLYPCRNALLIISCLYFIHAGMPYSLFPAFSFCRLFVLCVWIESRTWSSCAAMEHASCVEIECLNAPYVESL